VHPWPPTRRQRTEINCADRLCAPGTARRGLWRATTGRSGGAGHCLALFKLAAIVEAAWSQYLAGELRTDYAAALGRDVPALLAEACATAGLPA